MRHDESREAPQDGPVVRRWMGMPRWVVYGLAGVYAVMVAELYLRIAFPVPLLPRYVTAADYGIRMNVPNAHYWQRTSETEAEFRINAQGMRADHSFTYDRIPNRCRLLMLGDSFFMGYESRFEDSFQYELQRRLKRRGLDCEIMNLAVSGFGTAESLVTLEADGVRYSPDVVLLQWHRSDPSDNLRSGLFRLDDGHLVRARQEYLPGVTIADRLREIPAYRWLSENSHLYTALHEDIGLTIKRAVNWTMKARQMAGSVMEAKAMSASTLLENAAQVEAERHELNLRLLARAREVAGQHGAELMIVDIPIRNSRTEFTSSFTLLPQGWNAGFHTVSPIELFRARSSPSTKIYTEAGHRHLTPLGNALLANAVVNAMNEQGMLDQMRRTLPQRAENGL